MARLNAPAASFRGAAFRLGIAFSAGFHVIETFCCSQKTVNPISLLEVWLHLGVLGIAKTRIRNEIRWADKIELKKGAWFSRKALDVNKIEIRENIKET